MKKYTTSERIFSDQIDMIETTDLVNADVANAAHIQLLKNILHDHDSIERLKRPDIGIKEGEVVEGIDSFPDFLATMVSDIPLVQMLRNMYAGFQFVLHAGQLVNNCTSEATDLPLAAAQGKALWDKITAAVTALTTHKSSGDHDGRYYTESEINNLLNAKLSISNIVNNLTSTATNMALSAAQGKALNDKINSLNGESSGNATINTTYVNKISTTYVKWRKLGRLVTVEVYDIILKAGCNTYDVAVIATGLPAPKGGGFNASVAGNKPSTNETAIARLYVNANGVLKPWYIGNPSIEMGMNGSFSYISAS